MDIDMKYAEIIIDAKSKNLDKIFSYYIPDKFQKKIKIGMRAFIPFGKSNKIIEGYIIGFCNNIDIESNLIKEIYDLPDEYTLFNENVILLAKFMANKYYCTLSECLQCIMPKIVKEKTIKYVSINYNDLVNEEILKIKLKDNAQSRVIKFLEINKYCDLETLKSKLKISLSPINTLLKKNVLKVFKESNNIRYNQDKLISYNKIELTYEQRNVLNFLKNKLELKGIKKPILLQGVTGSGKTEVYLEIVNEVVKKGKQAIVLVPEISLTTQTIEKFVQKFGSKVSVTHSRLSDGERFEEWKKAKNGEISIIIGARSAIFTPFENLGIIIVDEEHESTYKAENNPKYDTRELAEKISQLTNCLVLFASATPSIESYYNTTQNKYDLITMKNRINKMFPIINVIDMKKEIESNNLSIFSKKLYHAIKNSLESGMQVILFLNRRGHSTFVSCRKCGYVMECDNCNVNYTYHLNIDKLVCHYCNKTINNLKICPNCNSKYIKYFGIGTQKIEEETKRIFPKSKILRMDLDTTTKKQSHKEILKKFKNEEANVLIGTQMIAKGLDFPKVSVVGVIAADLSIFSGHYKSSENSFQLLSQVSGRAGRSKYPGEVFIQTYIPEHYSIQYAKNNDYLGFYEKEIKERKNMFYPPFSNMFFIIMSSKNEQDLKEKIKLLFKIFLYYNEKVKFDILGPSMANIYKINNNFRFKIIIKGKEEERLKNFVLYCIEKFKKQYYIKDIRISIYLNPNFIQ